MMRIENAEGWIGPILYQYCLSLMKPLGLSEEALLQATGLRELPPVLGGIDVVTAERLLNAALQLKADPLLGLRAARHVQFPDFGLLGFISQSCANLGELLRLVAQYDCLLTDVTWLELEHRPGQALLHWKIRYATRHPEVLRQVAESMLASLSLLGRLLLNEPQDLLLAVHLQHAAPRNLQLLSEYQQVFQCPVYFDQAEYALVLSRQALEQPLRYANPALRDRLEQLAREQLQALQQGPSLSQQVLTLLRSYLRQGGLSRERVAAQLGLTARTLHRRLLAEGSSYQDILDDLRRELATQYLSQADFTVEDITQRLAFSESQSFIRWFRRHYGLPPGEYRRLQKAKLSPDKTMTSKETLTVELGPA